ncbi:dentin sialophosphoprotein-like [Chironomus tepperi]|uniref:dentin sialophosphoprotein-like n=1 Tax=Chironomus tepperi TaxID=113505 RepID=UPI00391F2FEF
MNFSSVQDLKKQQHQKNGKWNNVGESSNIHSRFSYFVKLAPESPLRQSLDMYNDESSYDSFHNQETDVCKDSTDDDFSDTSSKTEGYAVLDVEYEVASSSDEDNSDNSSISSGTDEFTLEAATTAFYEFNALVNGQLLDDDDSDEFILADTEDDTDGSIDLELGQADYWKCVKCNNRQNNPLYRYCEKCYQVRKSLFPPRPKKLRKTRTTPNRKRKMAQPSQDYSTTEIDSDSEFDSPVKKKFITRDESASPSTNSSCIKNGNQSIIKDKHSNENSKHANSAGELSCNQTSSDDCGDDGEIVAYKSSDVLTKIKVSPTESIEIAKVSSYPSTSLNIKLESSRDDNSYVEYKLENKIIQNVYRQELKCVRQRLPPNKLDWKDSGMSSCQESSQEFSSSPIDEGYLARTSSNVSSKSTDSQIDFVASQASTLIQQDSDEESDSEEILTRVEEYTKERQDKMKECSSIRPVTSDLVQSSEDLTADINDSNLGICRFCMINPKNGVFVHNNCLHLCCCYKCALKVWKKRKSCPICNCKIKNVTKIFVH